MMWLWLVLTLAAGGRGHVESQDTGHYATSNGQSLLTAFFRKDFASSLQSLWTSILPTDSTSPPDLNLKEIIDQQLNHETPSASSRHPPPRDISTSGDVQNGDQSLRVPRGKQSIFDLQKLIQELKPENDDFNPSKSRADGSWLDSILKFLNFGSYKRTKHSKQLDVSHVDTSRSSLGANDPMKGKLSVADKWAELKESVVDLSADDTRENDDTEDIYIDEEDDERKQFRQTGDKGDTEDRGDTEDSRNVVKGQTAMRTSDRHIRDTSVLSGRSCSTDLQCSSFECCISDPLHVSPQTSVCWARLTNGQCARPKVCRTNWDCRTWEHCHWSKLLYHPRYFILKVGYCTRRQ